MVENANDPYNLPIILQFRVENLSYDKKVPLNEFVKVLKRMEKLDKHLELASLTHETVLDGFDCVVTADRPIVIGHITIPGIKKYNAELFAKKYGAYLLTGSKVN